jgi:hypothetical protein
VLVAAYRKSAVPLLLTVSGWVTVSPGSMLVKEMNDDAGVAEISTVAVENVFDPTTTWSVKIAMVVETTERTIRPAMIGRLARIRFVRDIIKKPPITIGRW